MRRPAMRVLFALTCCAAATLAAQSETLGRVSPESVGLDAVRLKQASALLHEFVGAEKIAGAVAAVARNGKIAYLEAVGSQTLEPRVPMSERSIFRIYSMTKPIVAVGAAMLLEERKFALDDPVSKYLPEFGHVHVLDVRTGQPRPPARAVTVADLLLHTAGLSHRSSPLYRTEQVRSRSITLPQLIVNITRVPLMEDPGELYRYSEATTVVGRLIEIWSGQPLDVFLRERIFTPLEMIDTGFWAEPRQRSRLTTVYAATPGGGLAAREIEELPFTERPPLLEGSVGLLSTVPDFLRFSQMLLNRGELDGARILRPETVDRFTSNGLPEPILRIRGNDIGWGLANVNVAAGGEYGWDGTAGTIFWVDPSARTVILLMTQSVPANPDSLRQRFKSLVVSALKR